MMQRISTVALLSTIAAALPAQLAGSYSIGPSGNYANMTAAIADLNLQGVSAPVTFVAVGAEVGPWTINAFPGQGPNNPVVFEGLGLGSLAGGQPVLTLNGCASVTFQGFSGTFLTTPTAFQVNAGTTDCTFRSCTFLAPTVTSGAAVITVGGGTGLLIEDCEFGGGYEAAYVQLGASRTTIRRNKILGGGFWIIRLTGPDSVFENNFVTGPSNYGIRCEGANVKVLHNSVFIDHPTYGSQYCSIRWYAPATSATEVRDNIFCDNYTGTAALNMWCSGALRPAVMDNNCFWSNGVGYNCVFAGANLQLAGWQALGFDVNSIQADPQFVAPGTTTAADLRIQNGSACANAGALLASTPLDYFQAPRTVPVSIGAHENDGGALATYTVFGPGCPGALGVPTNGASNPPQLGSVMTVVFGNLPAPELAVAVVGFSNTTSQLGALPYDLAGFGAAGCFARVSPDFSTFLFGAANAASVQFTTPNSPGLMGVTYHTQALVLDPANNALGVSMSAAATAVIGL